MLGRFDGVVDRSRSFQALPTHLITPWTPKDGIATKNVGYRGVRRLLIIRGIFVRTGNAGKERRERSYKSPIGTTKPPIYVVDNALCFVTEQEVYKVPARYHRLLIWIKAFPSCCNPTPAAFTNPLPITFAPSVASLKISRFFATRFHPHAPSLTPEHLPLPAVIISAAFMVSNSLVTSSPTDRAQTTGGSVVE